MFLCEAKDRNHAKYFLFFIIYKNWVKCVTKKKKKPTKIIVREWWLSKAEPDSFCSYFFRTWPSHPRKSVFLMNYLRSIEFKALPTLVILELMVSLKLLQSRILTANIFQIISASSLEPEPVKCSFNMIPAPQSRYSIQLAWMLNAWRFT